MASCVAFGRDGPLKSAYRRFNISGLAPGDDYAAMRQALERRFRRTAEGGALPDVLLIDGGKGQLAQAMHVIEALQLRDIALVGVAKGEGRRPGRERLYLAGQSAPLSLGANSPALHLIQQVRDEAHRFAVTGHRNRRGKRMQRSPLEDIAGLGPKRRQALLRHFGGIQAVARANIDDLSRIKGISRGLAETIYGTLHSDD